MARANVELAGIEGVENSGWAIKHGAFGGIIAGIVFALSEMLAALITGNNFFGPPLTIAGVPQQTPTVKIDDMADILVGVSAHIFYSIALGVIVAATVAAVPTLYSSSAATIIFCGALGFISWPLNFYVITPLINVPWFMDLTNPLLKAIQHTMLGLTFGFYLASQLRKIRLRSRAV